MRNFRSFGLFLLIVIAACGSPNSDQAHENSALLASLSTTSAPSISRNEIANQKDRTKIDASSVTENAGYIGCWAGMGGGSLRITSKKIRDLGSGEESSYKELQTTSQQERTGLQTGEEYLLEADKDFPKSFLAEFIRLSFNSDKTVGIVTYDSYEDYLQNKFVGNGLFGKSLCR